MMRHAVSHVATALHAVHQRARWQLRASHLGQTALWVLAYIILIHILLLVCRVILFRHLVSRDAVRLDPMRYVVQR